MLLTQPLVSVITPSFNQGMFIERTIRSVSAQRQHYPFIEHIVIDGGSTDNSVEVLRKFSSSVNWISEPDRGFADAVNRGIAMAKGQVIGIQSSDDLYAERAVETAIAFLASNPDVSMVFGHFDLIDERDYVIARGKPLPFFTLTGYLLLDFVIPQPSAFFRKDVVSSVGPLDTSIDYAADMEFWLRIAAKHSVARIPARLAYVRVHQEARNMTSARFGREWLLSIEKNLENGVLVLEPEIKKAAHSAALINDALFEARNGSRRKALSKLIVAIGSSPRWLLWRRRDRLRALIFHLIVPKSVKRARQMARAFLNGRLGRLEKVTLGV